MKIVYVSAHMGGGVGKAVSGLALQSSGEFDVRVVLLEPPQEMKYIRILEQHGVPWTTAVSDQDMLEAADHSDALVLCWWDHPLAIRFLLCVRRVRCRMILWSHINGCYYPLLPGGFLRLFRQVLFTSPVSLENALWSKEERALIQSRSEIVYGMGDFDPAQFPQKTTYAFGRDHPVVGYVGTIGFEKISGVFIEFCAAAAKAVPDVEFRMIGKVTPAFREAVRRGGLEDRFSFLGYLEETEEAYLSFDIFGYLLQPKSYATTENVLLEAMAYGLPIIVLDNPVERHIVQDGVNGFVVGSWEEYAAKVLALCQSEDMRCQAGAQARRYAVKKYDAAANYGRFRQAVLAALEGPREPVDATALFRDGFEAFCYFSGMDRARLEAGDASVLEHTDAGAGESKAGIAQFCRYFPLDQKLAQLLEAAKKTKNTMM